MPSENTLQQINAAALKFLEPINLQKTYETITHQAVQLVDGIDGAILLVDEKNHQLTQVYSSSQKVTSEFDEENAYIAFKKKVAFVKSNTLFIPLVYQNKSMGTLIIRSKVADKFDDNDLEILKVFGSFATLAIRKAQLYQQNQSALKVRDLFISMATHELKTPLTSMTGYIQLLHSKMIDKKSKEFGWIETLLGEARRLNDLINEMTQTYTIKSGKVTFTWTQCRLAEILEKSIASFAKLEPQRQIEFVNLVPKEQDSVIGDCLKLEQVFDDVIDNAEKFSEDSKPIRVELYEDGTFLTVEVIDRGVGIPKNELPYIFDEFFKGKATETKSGMGLGLFFVKSIVQQHHGKIQISSTKKGTRVIIRMKRATL